ncbi:MAG: hypothetical protein K0R84_1838 [Clostridia bacterium]|jgi:hypothetical protein|nr:hypothetical protein [Clostridia bacterium]
MIKNKAAKALIIGACIAGSTMMGVYADTNTPVEKPAVVEPAGVGESQEYTIQIESIEIPEALTQKQQEIDKYVFEEHQTELEQKGITITHTGIVGEFVEVGITPYSQENADYLYGIFGKDMVKVVEGQQAVALDMVAASAENAAEAKVLQEEAPFFIRVINSIFEWFKNIF